MTTPAAAPLQDEIQALLQKHPPIIPATRIDTNTAIYVRVPQRREDKVTKLTSALEVKVNELIAQARKRRAYVHAIAMTSLTPAQYARALPQLTLHGYGVNVFPIHHIHPPLSMAVLGGHVKAAHALLQHGADPYLSYPSTDDYSFSSANGVRTTAPVSRWPFSEKVQNRAGHDDGVPQARCGFETQNASVQRRPHFLGLFGERGALSGPEIRMTTPSITPA